MKLLIILAIAGAAMHFTGNTETVVQGASGILGGMRSWIDFAEENSDKSANFAMRTAARNINSQSPMQLDSDVILLSSNFDRRTLILGCIFNKQQFMMRTGATEGELVRMQKERMYRVICGNPLFKSYRRGDVSVEFQYLNSRSKRLFNFTINPGACQS